ncbi:MAG: helix-turn-helix transcriptional regulator [Umezawaea sp.]
MTTALIAEQAWRDGDTAAAIETADHVLTTGTDHDCVAAGVAAAAAAADGGLFDAARRWRQVAIALEGAPAVSAAGRAALAAILVGDLEAAEHDLADARQLLCGSAPRGIGVLLDGVDAAVEAVRGGFDRAARRLAGLAAAAVPVDPFAAEQWDDLAVTVVIAGGDDLVAQEMLAALGDRSPTTRRRMLAAWLHLRAGRLSEARQEIAAASGVPTLRRDAVLAAAVTVGLARRAGDKEALRATWRRVAPVVAGADVEVLLLDAWGELSAGAAHVSTLERDTIVDAMNTAVAKAGSPSWCSAVDLWWTVQRAVVADDVTAASAAAERLTDLDDHRFEVRAAAARTWASILAGDPRSVVDTASRLAGAGQPWEAAALCGGAAERTADPLAAKELLSAGRAFRAKVAPGNSGGGLSKRERAVGELLVDGLTHKEIGGRLFISPKTVEQHVAKIRQKLLVSSRAELIAALRSRL